MTFLNTQILALHNHKLKNLFILLVGIANFKTSYCKHEYNHNYYQKYIKTTGQNTRNQ